MTDDTHKPIFQRSSLTKIIIALMIFMFGIAVGAYGFYYFSPTILGYPKDGKTNSTSKSDSSVKTKTFTDPSGIVSVVVESNDKQVVVYLLEKSTGSEEIPTQTKTKLLNLSGGEQYGSGYNLVWSNKVPDFGFAILTISPSVTEAKSFYLVDVAKNTANKINLPEIIEGETLLEVVRFVDDNDTLLVRTLSNEGKSTFWTINLSNLSKANKLEIKP